MHTQAGRTYVLFQPFSPSYCVSGNLYPWLLATKTKVHKLWLNGLTGFGKYIEKTDLGLLKPLFILCKRAPCSRCALAALSCITQQGASLFHWISACPICSEYKSSYLNIIHQCPRLCLLNSSALYFMLKKW